MSRFRKAIKGILRYPADAIVASSTRKPSVMEDPRLAAKFHPYKPELDSFLFLDSAGAGQQGKGLLIPPRELWWGYGKTPEEYVASGKEHVATMVSILQKANFQIQRGQRILDYGCAGGRMIRQFAELPGPFEAWGTDISAEHIAWCQQHLSPRSISRRQRHSLTCPFGRQLFRFDLLRVSLHAHQRSRRGLAIGTEENHAARRNDLYHHPRPAHDKTVVRSSVYSKRSRRIRYSWEAFADKLRIADNQLKFSTAPFAMFTLERSPHGRKCSMMPNTSHRHWGRIMKFRSVTPEAYGFQSAVLLEK